MKPKDNKDSKEPKSLQSLVPKEPKEHPLVNLKPSIDEHPDPMTNARKTVNPNLKKRPDMKPVGRTANIEEEYDILADRLAADWELNEYECSYGDYMRHNMELLDEATKKYKIDSRTSNYTLGKLKKRRDEVGAAARAEIARRAKYKPMKPRQAAEILKQHLTGQKVDPHDLSVAGASLDGKSRTHASIINAAIADTQDREKQKQWIRGIHNRKQYEKRRREKEAADKQKAQQIASNVFLVKSQIKNMSPVQQYEHIMMNDNNRDTMRQDMLHRKRDIVNNIKVIDALAKKYSNSPNHPHVRRAIDRFFNANNHIIHMIPDLADELKPSVANIKAMKGFTVGMIKQHTANVKTERNHKLTSDRNFSLYQQNSALRDQIFGKTSVPPPPTTKPAGERPSMPPMPQNPAPEVQHVNEPTPIMTVPASQVTAKQTEASPAAGEESALSKLAKRISNLWSLSRSSGDKV